MTSTASTTDMSSANRSSSRSPERTSKKKITGFKWKDAGASRRRDDDGGDRGDRDGDIARVERGYRDRGDDDARRRRRDEYDDDVRRGRAGYRDYDRDHDRDRDRNRDRDYDRNREDARRDHRAGGRYPPTREDDRRRDGRDTWDTRDTRGLRDDHRRDRDRDRQADGKRGISSFPLPQQRDKRPVPAPATAGLEMIVVTVNDRLGTKAAIPCLPSDPIGAFKAMVAARIGRKPHEIMLKRQHERPFKDHITLEDYGVVNGAQLDLEIDTGD